MSPPRWPGLYLGAIRTQMLMGLGKNMTTRFARRKGKKLKENSSRDSPHKYIAIGGTAWEAYTTFLYYSRNREFFKCKLCVSLQNKFTKIQFVQITNVSYGQK